MRSPRVLGATNVAVDWTLGCVAVERDAASGRVAVFAARAPAGAIHRE